MTSHPLVVADEEMSVEEAGLLMRRLVIRRLPVMSDSELKGIVTLSDISAARPEGSAADGKPLRESEPLRVRDVMSKKVLTCDANCPLEEVGALMRREKVGALPVMNGNRLVGIITESDVLDALVSITRVGKDTRRLYLRVPLARKCDIFREVIDIGSRYGIELYTLLTHPIRDSDSHLVM
jgi:acetoin utilization protein AcuB